MGDYYFGKVRGRVAATSVSTSGGIVLTIAAPSDTVRQYMVTGVQTSGDAAALVTIESPASTVIWRKRFAAAYAHSESFAPGTMLGAAGQAVVVRVSASTSAVCANCQAMVV